MSLFLDCLTLRQICALPSNKKFNKRHFNSYCSYYFYIKFLHFVEIYDEDYDAAAADDDDNDDK